MIVAVPLGLLDRLSDDGFDIYDARTRRLVVASQVGGVPFMRRILETLGSAFVDAPGVVSVMSVLLELEGRGILKVIEMDTDKVSVEVEL